MEINEVTLKESQLDDLKELTKTTTKLLLKVLGNLFSIAIYKDQSQKGSINHKSYQKVFGIDVDLSKLWSIHLWDEGGHTAVHNEIFISLDNKIPKDTLNKIQEMVKKYSDGTVRCSDCKKWIDYEENARHRYFAGVYCPQCWIGDTGHNKDRGGWYEVEKKETYN